MALQTGVSGSKVLILVGADKAIGPRYQGVKLVQSYNDLQWKLNKQWGLCFLPSTNCCSWSNGILLHVVEGWSLSNVMFVMKKNLANTIAIVSKQLEHVSQTLAGLNVQSTRRHLKKRLESLDWKLNEEKEISELIADDVDEVKSNLSQIGLNIEIIHQMISGKAKLNCLKANSWWFSRCREWPKA